MCVPIAANRAEAASAAWPRAAFAAALLALALAGCAGSKTKHPTPPPVEPAPVTRPSPPPGPRPAPPTPRPPEATPTPPARNFGQEKARRKLELSAEEANSVGASEVGYYLDVLLGRLKQRMGPGAQVMRQDQRIVVLLPPEANFPVGETALPQALRAQLAPLSQVLVEYRRVLVSVYVRPDASVVGASNPRLSEQRATVVAAYLGGAGIDPRRVLLAPPAAPRPGTALGRNRIEIELEPVMRPRARS